MRKTTAVPCKALRPYPSTSWIARNFPLIQLCLSLSCEPKILASPANDLRHNANFGRQERRRAGVLPRICSDLATSSFTGLKTELLHRSIGLASQTGRAETVVATKPFVCVHLVVVSDVLVGGACSVTGLDVQRKPVSLSGLNRVGKGT